MFSEELKSVKQWIVWKYDKKPFSAITRSMEEWNLEKNWTTFEDALRVQKECGFTGIGFVFKFPYVGIDLDDCIENDGRMNDLAKEFTDKIDTFTEYSRSGTGLHLYCKVTEPIKAFKTPKEDSPSESPIEIYGEGRFFVVTGNELDIGQYKITEQTENIKNIISKYRPVLPTADTNSVNPIQAQFFEGERNNRMTSEIGRMFNFWDKETVRSMAHILNKSMCNPPLADKDINTIVESISKRNISQIPPKEMVQIDWTNIEGKRDLDVTPYRGISKRPGSYISTGIGTLDYAMNDLAPGCVTLLSGRMNGGKSTFVNQIIANAIDTGNKVFAITGEGDQEIFINSIYACVIGRDKSFYKSVLINKRWHKEPLQNVLDGLKAWHKNKLTLFDKGQSKFKTTDELFKMIDLQVKEKGSNLIVIDNLMSILTAKATEKNEAQAEFMQNCHDLAIKHKIHIILVLHPNKEYRKNKELEVEQISGTSDLGNKADNVIAVIREYDEEKLAAGIDGRISLIKNRYYSNLVTCKTHFDVDTGMLLELEHGEARRYSFKWKKYMDDVEEIKNMQLMDDFGDSLFQS